MPEINEEIVCLNHAEFDETLEKVGKISDEDNVPFFILFTGEKLEETGKSWCPDCVVAEPIITNKLKNIEAINEVGWRLLVCPVIRNDYRTPSYFFRLHPKIQLKCVPTLIKWQHGKPISRLNDSQCQREDLVQELIFME